MEQRYIDIFWSHVRQGDGCWEWTASVGSHGYGQTWDGHTVLVAHRVSWMLANGPIPNRRWILHRCNNRVCVRPDHLYAGTPADNARDRQAAGMAVGGGAKGERQWNAKLTADIVLALRRRVAAGEPKVAVAAELGVSAANTYAILEGRSWKHLL